MSLLRRPSSAAEPGPEESAVRAALGTVLDPEIRRPITELGMVGSLEVSTTGAVLVQVLLTTSGCPLRDTLERDVTAAVMRVEGVRAVRVDLGVMDDGQRSRLRDVLRGPGGERDVPFARPRSLTRVYCVASGKGGVGKSTLTVNLAVAMARDGLRVGLVDADVHGFSVPGMLGTTDRPVKIDDVVIPPVAHGVKVISMGMVVPDGQPVMHRGPLLHRALQQFLTEVHFGDLDVLLLDMPPGTGDVPISAAQLLPGSELLVVTTPQPAAADVAHRSGGLAARTGQGVVGVVENMSWLPMPDGSRLEVFGSGGGAAVAERLSRGSETPVPLLAQVPMDVAVREGGDAGTPVVLAAPDSPAALVLSDLARTLGRRARGLAGRPLGVVPV
ncbi:Mrp/NBP35 family ATP-binding protein [Quadrisphaera setariae]|uniref:Mrp/NBP35 family ATP-binding protein n=1 Tax=Quadrisphaera setariae TaxID=2593304 RepID=UPI002104717A|nr:P-loop NTPase [Quadrisphaera setariae]